MSMPVDCNTLPANTTVDCSRPWGNRCKNKLGFDIASIWNITEHISQRCPTDPRLFKAANGTTLHALTQTACEQISGPYFAYYQKSASWTRLTTWKFPLLQLVAQFPRPPLGVSSEFFVMAHLLGDPIDTNKNLLLKLSKCQKRARGWKNTSSLFVKESPSTDDAIEYDYYPPGSAQKDLEHDELWKAVALLCDAYDEWDKGDDAERQLQTVFPKFGQPRLLRTGELEILKSLILEIAEALAADRATKYLPIVVALTFFIGVYIVALVRTKEAVDSDSWCTTIFINIEVHSIAFSALFFWLIPTVFLGSVIGVSQTEVRIRRILERFHRNIRRKFMNLSDLARDLEELIKDDRAGRKRIFDGGLYSWRPTYWHKKAHPNQAPSAFTWGAFGRQWWSTQKMAPYLIVLISTLFGILISSRVPPEVWNCRVLGEIYVVIPWFISAQLDFFCETFLSPESTDMVEPLFWKLPWPRHEKRTRLYWIMYVKDVLCTLASFIYLIFAVVGCLNSCSCWMSKDTGLLLPQRHDVDMVLRKRLNLDYPALIFSSLAIELILVPLCVWYCYPDALRVYVQRDDHKSNAKWYWKLHWRVKDKAKEWQRSPRYVSIAGGLGN